MEVRYILVETVKEIPGGDVIGMFRSMEDLIEVANELLIDYCSSDLINEFKDKLLVKIDRDHYLKGTEIYQKIPFEELNHL